MSYQHHSSAIYRLGIARGISLAGSEAAYIALTALVWERTGSAVWASMMVLAMIATACVLSPFAGMLGDRFDRRVVMIGSDVAAACCFVALPFVDTAVQLALVAALAAAVESPFPPASSASVPNLVPEDRLVWANSVLSTCRTIGHLMGPVVGGVLVAGVGSEAAFHVNAASFVVSVLLVASISGRFSVDRDVDTGSLASELAAGFRFMANDPVVRVLVGTWWCAFVAFGLVITAEYPLAEAFGTGAVGFGLIATLWGVGALVGAWAAPRLTRRFATAPVMLCQMLCTAVALVGTSFMPVFPGVLAMMVLGGYGMSVCFIINGTLLQQRAPDHIRSRVTSAVDTVLLSALALSLAGGGWFVESVGPQASYLVGGGCMLVGASVMGLLFQGRRWAAATHPVRAPSRRDDERVAA